MKLNNKNNVSFTLIILSALLFSFMTGCFAVGTYRTAQTLGEGESDFGMSVSASKIQTSDTTTKDSVTGETIKHKGTNVSFINLIPEMNYHIGVTDDLELGGRIALGSMFMELDAKYRFFQSDKLHLALQPSIGYFTFIVADGPKLTLPLIATYDISKKLSANVFGYGSYSNISAIDNDIDIAGESISAGGGLGLLVKSDTFYFMPNIDISKSMSSIGNDDGSVDQDITFLVFGVAFGWYGGKELKEIKKIDKKLDRIENKIDKL